MKARVKATGEIVEVHTCDDADFIDRNGRYYWEHELFFGSLDVSSLDDPDYWTKLEHQYAGMTMQGILSNQTYTKHLLETSTSAKDARDIIVDASYYLAHALVQKLKEKEERK